MASSQPFKPTPYNSRQPLAQQTNGISKMPSTRIESQPPLKPVFSEEDYLALVPGNNLARKKSNISHNGETDNSSEPYKSGPANRSVSNGIEKTGKRKVSNGAKRTLEDDEENWIHRDKLAQIESRELEAAGFPVGRMSRSESRMADDALRRQPSLQQRESNLDNHMENEEGGAYARREEKKQRLAPLVSTGEEHEDNDMIDFELRTPEEVAAAELEAQAQYFRSPPPTRPNGSRLPLPRASPVPVPAKIVERDSPLTRSRNGSSPQVGLPEFRSRSRSVGSQNLLEDEVPLTPTNAPRMSIPNDGTSPPRSSPPRAKVPKGAPTSGARKSSTVSTVRNVSTSKPRTSSQQNRESPQKRPGTSSGRPSTGHRPEGDPPWMASMYKPDPRLPPDQQILPTHAKRMAQEQWEKDGKIGTVYDREFRLLNTEELPEPERKPEAPPLQRPDRTKMTVTTPQWPLPTPPLGSPTSSGRPGTSGTEHGGYKMMPTIQKPTPTTPLASPKPVAQSLRLPEAPEDLKEKKGGCGACCLVM
jgi:hypothetical protein